jgi:site-specific DNA-methyltransferase (adenine-specific)
MKGILICNEDCITGMRKLPDASVDLVVTSPPYNVGIPYDCWNDNLPFKEYKIFTFCWLNEIHRLLKPAGRIALNIPYQVKMPCENKIVLMPWLYWDLMQQIGFKFQAIIDLFEKHPHKSKLTAWGSWLSATAPYIYNPKECVLIAYKDIWKRDRSKSYFQNTRAHKKEFIELVSGQWKCRSGSNKPSPAAFSLDIPLKAQKILSYEGDIILDPFMGSGTTAIACKKLNRRFIGFEISEKYCRIATERIKNRKAEK